MSILNPDSGGSTGVAGVVGFADHIAIESFKAPASVPCDDDPNKDCNVPSGKKLDETYKLAWVRGLKTTYYLRTLAATSAEKSTGQGGELNAVTSSGGASGNASSMGGGIASSSLGQSPSPRPLTSSWIDAP